MRFLTLILSYFLFFSCSEEESLFKANTDLLIGDWIYTGYYKDGIQQSFLNNCTIENEYISFTGSSSLSLQTYELVNAVCEPSSILNGNYSLNENDLELAFENQEATTYEIVELTEEKLIYRQVIITEIENEETGETNESKTFHVYFFNRL